MNFISKRVSLPVWSYICLVVGVALVCGEAVFARYHSTWWIGMGIGICFMLAAVFATKWSESEKN